MAKKPTPVTLGHAPRTDTLTFGLFLLGTVLIVGALLFLPAAVLGPAAEHWGPLLRSEGLSRTPAVGQVTDVFPC